MPHPAVFLDRDDTIIDNADATASTSTPGDLLDPRLVRLLPGAGAACALLQHAGWRLVVFTNQGGVAQGLGTLRDVEAVNERMRELLHEFDVSPLPVYSSPARPAPAGRVPRFLHDRLGWRKPEPGMIHAAARELEIDLARAWVVGDAARDVEAGVRAGIAAARCLRIGQGQALPDLLAAARRVLDAGVGGLASPVGPGVRA